MINSYGKNGKLFIVNLLEATNKKLTFPFIVGAYRLIDDDKLTNEEYVKIVFNDLIHITNYELAFDSCSELLTETIGRIKEVDRQYFAVGNFTPIVSGSSIIYNTDIFQEPLTPEYLYKKYSECFTKNKYSRLTSPTYHWGDYTKEEKENIEKAYNL